MVSKSVKFAVPDFKLSTKNNEIIRTQNFVVCLDQAYQKVPGILEVKFLNEQISWDILASDEILCREFCQLIRLTELILIKSFKSNTNQQQLEDNICNTLINFNGEQIINRQGQKELFVRQVPRYQESYVLKLNNEQSHVFQDQDFGKGFFFGPPLSQQQFNRTINNKLLEILRQKSDPDNFLNWFHTDVVSILQKKSNDRDDQFDAHKHPDKTGLCEVTLASGNSYCFVLIPNCQSQLYRTILSLQTLRYPALRFLTEDVFHDMFVLSKIWSCSIQEITQKDFVYKFAVLMNYAVTGQQQVHVHLIPSYKINDHWERFAHEPYVHNIKGNHEYQNLEQVADSLQQQPKVFIEKFQTVLIGNLKSHDMRVNWP